MDRATREALEMDRNMLVATVRSLDRDRNERIRELHSNPTFVRSTHALDPRVAELSAQQNLLIRRIKEIDDRLRGALPDGRP
jgi:hypothetical protein